MIETPGAKIRENFGKSNPPRLLPYTIANVYVLLRHTMCVWRTCACVCVCACQSWAFGVCGSAVQFESLLQTYLTNSPNLIFQIYVIKNA